MDGLSTRSLTHLENGIHQQIRLITRWRANSIGLISLANKHGILISIWVNSHCFNTHLLACFVHPSGDLSSVGNQYFIECLRIIWSRSKRTEEVFATCKEGCLPIKLAKGIYSSSKHIGKIAKLLYISIQIILIHEFYGISLIYRRRYARRTTLLKNWFIIK